MPDFVDKLRKESKYFLFAQALASLLVGFLSWSGLLVLLDLYDVYSPIQESDAGIWMVVIAAFVGGGSFLFLCYFWFTRPSPKELAQKVESAHPELNDLLNTAIEIEQKGEDPKFMEKRVLHELSRKESALDWHAVLRPSSSFYKFLIFGFLLGLALSVWNFHRTPLLKARAAFSDAPGLLIKTSLIGAPERHWRLADAEFRRGTDISIHAEILRDYRQNEEAWIEWFDGNGTTALKMLQKDKLRHWEWVFPSFDQPLKYRVVTPSLQSGWHRIEPYDPPKIEFVRWEMIPPDYLKMNPIVHNGLGYIEAPENSLVRLDVRVHDFPENISAILVSSEGNFSLEKTGRVTFTWQGVIDRELSAQLSLSDLDHIHRPEILSDKVVISPVPDEPPLVEITDPAKDLQLPYDADPQLIEVLASDDHGVAEIGLWVFHNGIEKEVDLFVDPVAKEKAVTGILDLSEFPLADVDVVTYMAFAGDTREPINQISESQIYFIEIGHPEKDDPPLPPSDAMGQEVWEIPLRKFINLNRELIKKNKMAMSLDAPDIIEPALEICAGALDLKNLMTIVYDDHGKSFPIDAGLDTGELFLEAIYDIEQVEVSSGDRDLVDAFKASLLADRKLVQIWGIFNKNKPPQAPGKMKPNPYNRKAVLEKLKGFQKKLENLTPTQAESGPKE